MSLKSKLSELSGVSVDEIPAGYQLIGDIILVKFLKKMSIKDKRKLSAAYLEIFPYVRLICERKGVSGELRQPKVVILSFRDRKNRSTETVHKEHGIFYKLDVAKIMFSKGNLLERQRVAKQLTYGETVLDMFAGIGYFSLGIAKHSKSLRVYSIEKNRIAFKYLKENIKLNHLKNITPILGDCRRVKRNVRADRMMMGYFPGTQKFLPTAFKFLKKKGVIHYHNTYKEKELWFKPLIELERAAKKAGYRISAIFGRKIVKSYAPRVYHIVIDAEFERK
ncbi:MAG: class I SAM-dependent methyltransferase family protein [Candidatus Aenigmatarchaeota archaeon]